MIWDIFFAPFAEFGFMRRAVLGCIAISIGATPVGVFLMLRRMSLTGDAMACAILPGAAVGYLISGLSLGAMTIGGLVAGMAVALLSAFVTRFTVLKEDASLAAFYLISLALGVLIISTRGSNVDLMHVLFGSVLALDDAALILLCSIASLTVFILAAVFRPLVLECADPQFLRSVSSLSAATHLTSCPSGVEFGCWFSGARHADGRRYYDFAGRRRAFWANNIGGLIAAAVVTAIVSSLFGLLFSYHFSLPSGPAIILVSGVVYVVSLVVGPVSGLIAKNMHRPTLET